MRAEEDKKNKKTHLRKKVGQGSDDKVGRKKPLLEGHIFLRNLLLAAISSLITDLFTAPVERIKLILQVKAHSKTKSIPVSVGKHSDSHQGIIYFVRRIIAKEGFFGLWKGTSSQMLYSLPNQSLTFALKDRIVLLIAAGVGVDWPNPKPMTSMTIGLIGGGLAGSIVTSLIYPMDFARTALAIEKFTYKGKTNLTVFSVLGKTYKKFGFGGIYRGLPLSMLGIVVYRSFYFGVFEFGMGFVAKHRGPPRFFETLGPAFVASSTGSLLSYPIDTLRRVVMMKDPGKNGDGMKYVATKIYKKSGIRGFYGGILANQLRSTAGAIMLVVYHSIQSKAK